MKKFAQETQPAATDDKSSPYDSLFETGTAGSGTPAHSGTPASDSAELARDIGNVAVGLQGAGLGISALDRLIPGRDPVAESNARAQERINELTNERDAQAQRVREANETVASNNRATIERALQDPARVRAYADWMNELNQRIAAMQDVRMTPDGSMVDVSALPPRTQAFIRSLPPDVAVRLFPDVGSSIMFAADEAVPRTAVPGLPTDLYSTPYNRLDEIALRFANPDAANAYDSALRSGILRDLEDPTQYHYSHERAQQHPVYTGELERARQVRAVAESLDGAMRPASPGARPDLSIGSSGTLEVNPEFYIDPATGLPGNLRRAPASFYALARDFPELFPNGVELRPGETTRAAQPAFDPRPYDSSIDYLRQQIADNRVPPGERPGPWRRGLHNIARVTDVTTGLAPLTRNADVPWMFRRGPQALGGLLDMVALARLGDMAFGATHPGMNYYTTTPNLSSSDWDNMERK